MDDKSFDNIYEVEKIIDKRWNKMFKSFEYLIKWLNYPEEENTWILRQDLVRPN